MFKSIFRWITAKVLGVYYINLKKRFGKPILDMYEGNQLYHDIKEMVEQDVTIIFDFDGVVYDSSFINFAICKHLECMDSYDLKENFIYMNLSESKQEKINEQIRVADMYWSDTEYRKTLLERQYEFYDA